MSFHTYHDIVRLQGGTWVLGLWGCLQCLNISSIIWTYRVDEWRMPTTMSFLERFSYLFQYPRMVAMHIKCCEIYSRVSGWDFQLGKFNQGYGDHGMGARQLKIEENRAKCTEQVLHFEANLYTIPCPARCCWRRSTVNTGTWAEWGSQEDHFWWRLYQWCACSCRGPWDAFLDGIMTLESSVTVASSERCQWSFPHDVNPRSFHR